MHGRVRSFVRSAIVAAAAVVVVACAPPRPPVLPGSTSIAVRAVTIDGGGEVDYAALRPKLGQRPGETFNEFRLAEDRRRIRSYLQSIGYFDAVVAAPVVAGTPVAIAWRVDEGARYTIGSVDVVGAPPAYAATFAAMIPFGVGDRVDLPTYRVVRQKLAARLREDGYGRATVASRTFVDRAARTVAWFYYVEPGPRTRIGAITILGNRRVPAEAIEARTGLRAGGGYSAAEKRRAELALLDTGAFASATVLSEADDPGPAAHPDRGGVITADQLDADGRFVPRTLAEDVAVRIAVVEAPARQLRAEVGVEADRSRVDAYAGARVVFRDLFAPFQHLLVEGNVGHGWFIDDGDPVQGLYGGALAQYQRPGFLAHALELRLTARWRDTLRPSALVRTLAAGPSVRATVAPTTFVEAEVGYQYDQTRGLPMLDAVDGLALPSDDATHGVELAASLVIDRRDDRVEPTDGWLASARVAYAPGAVGSGHRWLQVIGEARGFVPLTAAWSLAGRARYGAVTLGGDDGVPLAARLFGGGVDGMRGFERDRLAPVACAMGACDVVVGGRGLAEASAELRYLPPLKLYGAALFVDAGAAGAGLDPLAAGVSLALGAGLRLRSWYLPLAIDVAYRLVDHDDVGAAWDRVRAFVHIGEAF